MTTPVLTPRVRIRRILGWLALGAVVVMIGALLWGASSATQPAETRGAHPESHAPVGFHALTTVLRDRGVDVRIESSWTSVRDDSAGATVVFGDTPALSDDALQELLSAGADVVALSPSSRTLELGWGASLGDYGSTAAADCQDDVARNAGAISEAQLYTGAAAGCFPGTDGAEGSALITSESHGRSRIAIDANSLFTNEKITRDGNAALALGLLGRHETLVWYVASAADSDLAATDATLADFAPGWVTPVIILGLCVAAAAGVWRGRRFGPLVAERLPVSVRISETLEGRARLYAHSRDTAHAARILRRTSTATIGQTLGLGTRASVTAVIDATAVALGAPADQVRAILAGPLPTTDAALLRLSDSLTRLEAATHAAVRAEGKQP